MKEIDFLEYHYRQKLGGDLVHEDCLPSARCQAASTRYFIKLHLD